MKKRQLKFTLPISALLVLSACGMAPEERLDRAEANLAQSDYQAARLDLITALKEQPENSAMLALLVRTQIGLGDGEGALASLDKLAAIDPQAQGLNAWRAEAEVLRGKFEQALVIVDGVETPEAFRVAALAHIGLENVEAAQAAIAAGLALKPEDASLWAVKARLELATGDISGARTSADKAVTANPALHDALLTSAQVFARQNRLSDAARAFEAGRAAHPGSVAMLLGKIAVLGDLGRLKEAAELLNEAGARLPDSPEVLFLQAKLAAESQDWAQARTLLQSKEAVMRGNPNIQIIYAEALLRLDQVEQARTWLTPIVRRYPDQRQARILLGEAQLASGDAKAALETLLPIAARSDAGPALLSLAADAAQQSRNPRAEELRGRALLPAPEWFGGELAKADTALRNEDWARASKSYAAIHARLSRPNALVLNNYAYALGKQGQNETAVDLALKAVALEPENAAILDTAGWLLFDTATDVERGKMLLKKAARLAPDNAAIARRLAEASS